MLAMPNIIDATNTINDEQEILKLFLNKNNFPSKHT
jgi:hypothetical protein